MFAGERNHIAVIFTSAMKSELDQLWLRVYIKTDWEAKRAIDRFLYRDEIIPFMFGFVLPLQRMLFHFAIN